MDAVRSSETSEQTLAKLREKSKDDHHHLNTVINTIEQKMLELNYLFQSESKVSVHFLSVYETWMQGILVGWKQTQH